MSLWRKEASKQLPDLQPIIAAPSIHNASDLWIQLSLEFDKLLRKQPLPKELLARVWEYAKWSLEQSDEEVQQAVVNFFFEDLKDTRNNREVCPQFMPSIEYAQFFCSHNPGP